MEKENKKKQSKPYNSPRTIAIAATNKEKVLVDRWCLDQILFFVYVCVFLCRDIFRYFFF